jgi:hypothetical protein
MLHSDGATAQAVAELKKPVNLDDFKLLKVIGKGRYALVFFFFVIAIAFRYLCKSRL